MPSMLKLTLGYIGTLITRYTPLDLSHGSLEGIFSFARVTDSIITSGQPTEAQFQFVKDAGVRFVINLAPHGAENSLRDEAGTLRELGLEYVHIPVDFRHPTEAKFAEFCAAMERVGEAPVLVHCAANARASAFMFRYRRDVLNVDPKIAERDLHRIWKPYGVWKDFIAPSRPD